MKCSKCGTDYQGNFCPNCGEPAPGNGSPPHKQKKQKKIKVWQIVVAVVLIITVIGMFSGGDKATAPSNPSVQESTEPEAIQISARDLLNTYDENQVNADNLYKDKTLLVTGLVRSIGKDIVDATYITVNDGEQFELITVQCYFTDKKEIDKVAQLKEGDPVNVLGTCSGKPANVTLKGCILR